MKGKLQDVQVMDATMLNEDPVLTYCSYWPLPY
jgi:hypothetical protein